MGVVKSNAPAGRVKQTLQAKAPQDRILEVIVYFSMTVVTVLTIYPFLNVLAISLNDSVDTVRGGITVWPRQFTLDNYSLIFTYGSLITGFKISFLRTVIGTIAGLISGSMLAYTLARSDFQARRFISIFLAVTMYVTGGLIPGFILMRDLHLIDTFAVYILPGLVSAFNVFVIRSFIDGLPYALQESAKLDGANDFTIYWRVILPLCKPALATVALFLAVGQWNSWFDTYLFNGSNESLTTLQYELMKILQSTTTSASNSQDAANMAERMSQISPESVKMAITIVVTVPILIVYPFLQKYFVKGMTLGAVKS
ncbi:MULTISPECIES: carbohydrate ABC transporter permease [Paenibacillus]|uniref:Sugar ABC transporter permease n=2 Tax=Paenibacillus TaxID=44249 RepID=A0A089M5J0_9BACL|nr:MULTISPECIES: carbohydrate ABC transporter permease [Paenibacillus]AIQ67635.1 sugar ABC transporter permease [Paenibacillus graminis]KWX72303.1 sugar ABC transporter permease [Paenibacillus jilunlii]MEC0170764.1 carbohydrate ABC transporter permease [Paenibacillus graminis]SDM61940.1 carbohydrate ABC transporter membrane protein 2, CUT1 family [Paenibacillus jilunlii]